MAIVRMMAPHIWLPLYGPKTRFLFFFFFPGNIHIWRWVTKHMQVPTSIDTCIYKFCTNTLLVLVHPFLINLLPCTTFHLTVDETTFHYIPHKFAESSLFSFFFSAGMRYTVPSTRWVHSTIL